MCKIVRNELCNFFGIYVSYMKLLEKVGFCDLIEYGWIVKLIVCLKYGIYSICIWRYKVLVFL